MELACKTKLVHGGKKQGTFVLRTKAFFRRIEAGFWMPFSPEFRAGAHLKRAKLLLEAYERSGKEKHLLKAEAAIRRALDIYEKARCEKPGISAQGLLENAECLLYTEPANPAALENLRKANQVCGKALAECKDIREKAFGLLVQYADECPADECHTVAGFAYGFAAGFAPDSRETARLHYEAFKRHLKSGVTSNIIASAGAVLNDSCTDYHGRVRFAIETLNGEFKAAQG